MICCALIVVIIIQLLAPVRWLHRAVYGDGPEFDGAAIWTPEAAQAAHESVDLEPVGILRRRNLFAAAILAQIFVIGVLAPLEFPFVAAAGQALFSAHEALCGALGL